MIQNNRKDELYAALAESQQTLPICGSVTDNVLSLGAFSAGSWYLELIPKTKHAFQVLFLIALSVGEKGRHFLWRRLEAETKMRESKAELAEIEVDKGRITLLRERAVAIKDLTKAAKDLADFRAKNLSTLPDSDPIKHLFDQSVLYLGREKGQ